MQDQAQTVIVGAGIAGASIAYHLTQLGCRDVVVLEQSSFVSGTTSHAPGLVGQLRSTAVLTKMLMYSVSLYRTLHVDGVPGFEEVGGIRLASSKARLEEIKEQKRFADAVGLEAHLISAKEVVERIPIVNAQDIEGALWIPSDGSATAPILAQSLINRACAGGAKFWPQSKVMEMSHSNREITVRTATDTIKCERLVIAAGIWSPLVAKLAGVPVPLTPMQHQYAISEPLSELGTEQPVPNLRDPDHLIYFRQKGSALTLGGYERNPAVFAPEGIPAGPDPTVLDFDRTRFDSLFSAAKMRVPALSQVALERKVNGLESFTPDGEFLLGPSRVVPGLWFACGFCAHGISGSGGIGKVLAEWLVNGKPEMDVELMDPERFGERSKDVQFVQESAKETYATYYDLKQKVQAR